MNPAVSTDPLGFFVETPRELYDIRTPSTLCWWTGAPPSEMSIQAGDAEPARMERYRSSRDFQKTGIRQLAPKEKLQETVYRDFWSAHGAKYTNCSFGRSDSADQLRRQLTATFP